jgi:hypothetical protein
MALIRREWKPKEADEWTREDWFAIILSPLSYVALMVGTALSMLLLPVGFIILGAGIGLTLLLVWVINPKLSTISTEYEKKQKDYILELEKITEWEETE